MIWLLGYDKFETSAERIESACLMTSNWSNFGHWMGEHLLKLRSIEKYMEMSGNRPTLILGQDPPKFVFESLETLGFDKKDCRFYTGEPLHINKLVIPRYPHPTPGTIKWLQERYLGGAGRSPGNSSSSNSRIYISRADADRKNVINEAEVVKCLHRYGFERYVLGNLHVVEQAQLFANAEYIIGPTGSGFHNLVFSDDPTIIELVPDAFGIDWYCITNMMDFDHYWLFCDFDDYVSGNILVDINKLESLISATLEDAD
jgi:capsular polysaccharide biosynthesis protein